ncbi:hypothetical protein TELCIR_03695 [Teladorsagia circumcincta]|uniref:Uncharacterized protein n=1 Tax=Teladorsagia circumcincta TaxID=45464 RepID=A0A2G9UVL4_TELCI|nr:hypothetical protein TELCIR_03695 [Teladorsagia circumcincta]
MCSEDAAAQYLEITAQPPLKSTKHRHSVHTSTMQQLHINAPTFEKPSRTNGQYSKNDQAPSNGPQRSTSSDYCREERRDTISSSNKFLKWLGIGAAGADKKDMKNRRMSTFT